MLEKRLSLVNSKKALEKEINELVKLIEDAETEELYNALISELDELEDDLDMVKYELGEF